VVKGVPGKSAKAAGVRVVVDHNMQAMFLHVLADTLGSVGVIISTYFVEYHQVSALWLDAATPCAAVALCGSPLTSPPSGQMTWTDPVAAFFISALIIASVLPLLRQCADVLLLRVPAVSQQAIEAALRALAELPGVHEVLGARVRPEGVFRVTGTDLGCHTHWKRQSDCLTGQLRA
jgi:Co/Zn/Cd efflux system component